MPYPGEDGTQSGRRILFALLGSESEVTKAVLRVIFFCYGVAISNPLE